MNLGKGLVLMALSLLVVAASAAAIQPSSSPPVHLVAPVEGTALIGGATAAIEWAPAPGFQALEAEEWEAFLSVDGGASYPWRITPHLDADLHRFFWKVPNLPADNVRLLVRFGDEENEVGIELPQRLSIHRSPVVQPTPTVLSRVAGEAARPGDTGVAHWVEGDRRGGSTREFRMAGSPLATRPATLPAGGHHIESAVTESQSSAPDLDQPMANPIPGLTPRATTKSPQIVPSPPIDALLQTCRLNE